MHRIEKRSKVVVNTDPQRRCYNGAHFSSEVRWTEWDWVQVGIPEDKVKERLTFWRWLNDYAMSQGQLKTEYRSILQTKEI